MGDVDSTLAGDSRVDARSDSRPPRGDRTERACREEDAQAAFQDALRDEPGWGRRASSRSSSTNGTCRRTRSRWRGRDLRPAVDLVALLAKASVQCEHVGHEELRHSELAVPPK